MLPRNFADPKVCIVGLGYVGLTLAVTMAERGFSVLGLESNAKLLASLKQGKAHFYEKQLDKKLQSQLSSENLMLAEKLTSPCEATVYIITTGTPLGENNLPRVDTIEKATAMVSKCMPENALVILRSTVQIGTSRNMATSFLDKSGKPYQIAMCPERTLEGRALEELRRLPQIVGADDPETRHRASQIFSQLTNTVVTVKSLETAELIKLVDNSYRDVQFALANEIANIADQIGVNVMEVIEAGRLGYARTNVAQPGPVGGPCLEKDPHILGESLRAFGGNLQLISAGRQVNEQLPEAAVTTIETLFAEFSESTQTPAIALLGWAFKGQPATDDMRGSTAFDILASLRKRFPTASITGFDALVENDLLTKYCDKVASTLEQATAGKSIVVIMNNHQIFAEADLSSLASRMIKPSLIYDLWNLHLPEDLNLPDGVHYASLGNRRGL